MGKKKASNPFVAKQQGQVRASEMSSDAASGTSVSESSSGPSVSESSSGRGVYSTSYDGDDSGSMSTYGHTYAYEGEDAYEDYASDEPLTEDIQRMRQRNRKGERCLCYCACARQNHLLVLAGTVVAVVGIVAAATGHGEWYVGPAAYVVYLVCVLGVSRMCRQLGSWWDADDAMDAFDLATSLPGYVLVEGEAYHYESTGGGGMEGGGGGRKKVVTASATAELVPDDVVDMSKIPNFAMYPRAFVDVVIKWDLDRRSRARFRRWMERWRDRQHLHDAQVDITKEWALHPKGTFPHDIIPRHFLSVSDSAATCLSPYTMLLFTVFLLAWPYMMYVERSTVRVTAYIAKKAHFSAVHTARSSRIRRIHRKRRKLIDAAMEPGRA